MSLYWTIFNPTFQFFFKGVASRHLRRGRRGLSEENAAAAGEPTAEVPTAAAARGTEVPTAAAGAGAAEVPTATAGAGAAEVPGVEREPGPEKVRRLGETGGEFS